jgi:hypothetical protein
MFLPLHLVKPRHICSIDGVFSNTLMSPAEYSRSIVSDWSAKEGCGNDLTGNVDAPVKVSGHEVFAVRQDSNVACGTFAEASSADWSAKEGCGNVLTSDSLAVDKVDSGHCWRVFKHFDVTCGTFAEASSAD